jgi:Mg2+ and Co2+ transporter CorA
MEQEDREIFQSMAVSLKQIAAQVGQKPNKVMTFFTLTAAIVTTTTIVSVIYTIIHWV